MKQIEMAGSGVELSRAEFIIAEDECRGNAPVGELG
jgi:hypothetical protein